MNNQKRRHISAQHLDKSGLIEFYSKLIEFEFRERDPADVYALAFSRLLKPDCPKALFPEHYRQAPEMIGTDERDLFVPIIRDILDTYRRPIRVLDIGAGDGQTVNRFIGSIPDHSEISIIEPNATYVEQFAQIINREQGRVKLKSAVQQTYSDCIKDFKAGSFDLILSLHSIYFLSPAKKLLDQIHRLGDEKAKCIFVFADEMNGYTGKVVNTLLSEHDPKSLKDRRALLEERHDLFGLEEGAEVRLAQAGFNRLKSEQHESRLYGHDLGDLMALGFITDLPFVVGSQLNQKINAVLKVLCSDDENIDLSLECVGLRSRMISVKEPQIVQVLERSIR